MVDAEKKSSLRKMLSDAVPLLCRSSLGIYDSKLSVEAIICITVNNTDLVHISFNEMLSADGHIISHAWRKCETPNFDACSQEPEHHDESSDSPSSSDLNRLNKQSVADEENGGAAFDDRNLDYDAVDTNSVDLDEWNEVKPNDSWRASTARKRRNRHTSVEKTLRHETQVNDPERRVLDEPSHQKRNKNNATLAASQNLTPDLAAPEIKIEQVENDDCLFVKMETDTNNDDYDFSAVQDITAFDTSFPAPTQRRLRTRTSFETGGAVGRHSFSARGVATRSYSHVAHRLSHVRPRLGKSAREELNRMQSGDHSSSAVDYQDNQSATSVLSSSGTLLPFSLENHHPEPIPPTPSQFAPKKRCRVCYAKKVRKEVRFCCSACPDRPGLCLNPCFYEYHELFVVPKFFPQGAMPEYSGGSMQEHNSAVEHGRSDLLHLPDVPGKARQSPDT